MFGLNRPIDFGPAPDMGPQIAMPQAAPKKGGMFGAGKGNIGEIISAALSGYLAAGGNPAGQMGLQMLHQRRQQAAEQAQYGQRREDEFQDWVRKQAYQQANPNPVNNDTVADYNFWKQTLPPEQFNTWLENKINPPQLMNIPGVGVVSVPRQGGQQGGAPAAPGVTFTPMEDEGGPMPSASGGFPRPF
jgi:hypothetical protein